MIYYSIPYSTERNLGEYYNSFMENLPNDTDFACFVDGDTIFTTSNFGTQIASAVERYPDCRFFTCYTNRIGFKQQIHPLVDQNTNDMEYHRNFGRLLQDNHWDECDELPTSDRNSLISGMFLLIRKDLWREVGGFKSGMLSVDNDFHQKCIDKNEKLLLLKGVYIYHWYRWPNANRTEHLKLGTNLPAEKPKPKKNKNNKKVVFTCIYGNYDTLKDPLVVENDWDYICFTDQKLKSNVWEIRDIPKDCLNENEKKVQRKLKIISHRYLTKYETSIWIDANLELKIGANEFLEKYGKSEFNTCAHPERTCIYEELDACERLKKDSYNSLDKIRKRLLLEKYPTKNGLVQTSVIIRQNTDDTINGFCEVWWSLLEKYSHRDQTVFNYALWKYPSIAKKIFLFSALSLYEEFNQYKHIIHGNSDIKPYPPKPFGSIDNYLNGKLAFDGKKLLSSRNNRWPKR